MQEFIPLKYPPTARQIRTSGDVEPRVTLNENGTVSDVTVVNAVREWKFVPTAGAKGFDLVGTFALTDPGVAPIAQNEAAGASTLEDAVDSVLIQTIQDRVSGR